MTPALKATWTARIPATLASTRTQCRHACSPVLVRLPASNRMCVRVRARACARAASRDVRHDSAFWTSALKNRYLLPPMLCGMACQSLAVETSAFGSRSGWHWCVPNSTLQVACICRRWSRTYGRDSMLQAMHCMGTPPSVTCLLGVIV